MKKALLFSASALMLATFGFAQEEAKDGCITHKVMNDYFTNHPEAKKSFEAREAMLQKQDAESFKTGYKNGYKNISAEENERSGNSNSTQGTVYYVPVVFHILHEYGPENITDAQVLDCINQMNLDYRKLNSDTTQTIAIYKSLSTDAQIEFRLATKDPSGNCTNGIVRHVDPNTVWLQGNWSWYAYTWNPTEYLNVYVVKSINGTAAAYTYLPGTFPSGYAADVVVARYDYVGSIGASQPSHAFCISHEAGHWFNLEHPWGNTNSPNVACGDDGVTDTPVTEGSAVGVCNTALSYCNPPVIENVQNYMDYSYCSTMFTAGQVTRMRNTIINNTGNVGRPNVVTAANQQVTGILTYSQICVPVANFHASNRTVCINTVITFSDSSSNAHTTQWNWSFPGGTMQGGTTVTDSMPKVSYAAPGVYAVSYTAATTAGANSITKTSYITVVTNVATYNTNYVESFETSIVPGPDWSVNSSLGSNWTVTNTAAATGSKSIMIDNINNTPNDNSTLESTSFDISNFISPIFTFKVAYQQQATTNVDKLQIFSSTDCGNVWTSRWAHSGTALATVTPPSTVAFVPGPSQFTTYTVNINAVVGSTNVRFLFDFFTDPTAQGNNIYIDDINIIDAAVGINKYEAQLGLEIYPNPSSGAMSIDLTLNQKQNISVTVTDLLGRTIETIPVKQYATGSTKLTIADKTSYQPGVYLININVDGNVITKKIIMQ